MNTALPEPLTRSAGAAEIYCALLDALGKIGSYEVEEKKSSLHIKSGRAAFLGVHPRKEGLRLNIVLARPLTGTRVVKSEQVSKSRYHNEIDLKALTDIDAELVAWLEEAHQLQQG